jgi:adenosine deaminase
MYLPLCAGLPKPRYSLCYSLDTETPSLLQLSQVQANKHPAPTDSYSGDELVKKERTGSLVEILDVKLQYCVVSVNDDSIYQIPRELGGSKAYENMRFHHLDRNSSSFMSS